jgi:hypothetical protein
VKAGAACLILLSALAFGTAAVQAHSASDAYLNLTVDSGNRRGMFVVHGQWDIALRDLDFVLKLDDDGDGRLRWGEVRHHQAAIERYAYAFLGFSGNPGAACEIKPTRQMIDDHADGAYAALFFDVICRQAPLKLRLKYNLFFAIDPSHRGILVMHDGANVATAVLSPQNDVIDLTI